MPFYCILVVIFQAVQELLKFGADPNLELTHGSGNSLCVAISTQFEGLWKLEDRFDLVSSKKSCQF